MSWIKTLPLLALTSACLPEPPAPGPGAGAEDTVVADAAPPRADAAPRPDAAPIAPPCEGVNGPDGTCYFVSAPGLEGAVAWASATLDCAEQGGQLATITSADENALLIATFCPGGICEALWIGLHDRTTEGLFVWNDGTPLGFTAWGQGEPNNNGPGEEDCTELVTLPVGGALAPVWNDAKCVQPRRAICERN